MQRKLQEHYAYIKSNIQEGNTTLIVNNPAQEKIDLNRTLRWMLIAERCSRIIRGTKITGAASLHYQLFDNLFIAMLAELYGVGNCGEQSAVALTRFLKSGINKSIEFTTLNGISSKGNPRDHVVLLLDRDEKSTQLQDLKTWKNLTIFHAWHTAKPESYNGDQYPKVEDLSQGFIINMTSCTSTNRWDRNLNKDDCEQMISLLTNLKKVFNEEIFSEAMKRTNVRSNDIKKEVAIICKKIDEEIFVFNELAKYPPYENFIKHYEKANITYDCTLFRCRVERTQRTPQEAETPQSQHHHKSLNFLINPKINTLAASKRFITNVISTLETHEKRYKSNTAEWEYIKRLQERFNASSDIATRFNNIHHALSDSTCQELLKKLGTLKSELIFHMKLYQATKPKPLSTTKIAVAAQPAGLQAEQKLMVSRI